jgi:hypothetical protein
MEDKYVLCLLFGVNLQNWVTNPSEITAVGIRHADHVAPINPQKLALGSPTSGGRLDGIVLLRTQTTEFVCVESLIHLLKLTPTLTSPTSGGRSVGIVGSRIQATEFFFTLAVSEVEVTLRPSQLASSSWCLAPFSASDQM